MAFSDNFKRARENASLTQKQVADALGLERSAIAHYEKGDSTPNFKNIPKICELLNVTIDELIKP